MIPFKCAWVLNREVLKRPIVPAFIDSLLWELEWQNTKKRWKRQMLLWEKIKEHGRGTKGKVVKTKLREE